MERDDIIEYSLDAHHSEEAGKKIRKKIYFVTIFLTLVTTVEVMLGSMATGWGIPWPVVKWIFIVLTLVKATYIVMTFMHLGHERRSFRALVLLPYGILVLYLIYIALWEAAYVQSMLEHFL